MFFSILLGNMWLIHMDPAKFVIKKYQTAIQESEESEQYYQDLCENLNSSVQKQWEDKMANAQAMYTLNISAMDIFNLVLENGMYYGSLHLFAHESLQLHPVWRNNWNLFVRSQNLTSSEEAHHGLRKDWQSRNHSAQTHMAEKHRFNYHNVQTSACSGGSMTEKEKNRWDTHCFASEVSGSQYQDQKAPRQGRAIFTSC